MTFDEITFPIELSTINQLGIFIDSKNNLKMAFKLRVISNCPLN
jgi:hypothetical protein